MQTEQAAVFWFKKRGPAAYEEKTAKGGSFSAFHGQHKALVIQGLNRGLRRWGRQLLQGLFQKRPEALALSCFP
jgi:hypothetical protein